MSCNFEYSKKKYKINFKKSGAGRKDKINDEKYKMIIEMLKEVNTLSAFDIHKKLIDNGVSVSNKN